ncbi:MAG TPA: phenylalanine--tRNA ligase subunit beta [Chloroflexi bacterium]|jgi:phenylalanyl-tRNA synthetase beta chain|nr:phenylalanine--tRNA ligase subunit beta [Chloroflexota bacterium]HAL26045.1 phenylalanine--tRNA ligase subunit beta [Chloroflexota bacterium]
MPTIRVPLSWLREYVEAHGSAEEIGRGLHMSGTEVDRIERPGGGWDHVWVGRIAALEKHPNADKLQLVTVEYGEGRTKTVVTGAPNIRAGDVVPYAEVGARLRDAGTGAPGREAHGDGWLTLEPKKVRGIMSEGMVCSERELGLGDDHDGILILDQGLAVGQPLADALGDPVLVLELQPNRPDCMGVVGVAREVAAVQRVALREPKVAKLRYQLDRALLDVRIEDPEACPRFGAAYLENVTIGPSPKWMQQRLTAAGMRPIHNAVDITNYVMLELGQPLHAYDADRLRGHALVARRARSGESLRTLDGVERILSPDLLVIADDERSLGIAGILGGQDSEIRPTTTKIALECASFEPRGIDRTAAKLGLSQQSAASARFRLALSPELVPLAVARAAQLLVEHADARIVGAVDVYPSPRPRPNVRLRFSDILRVLGVEIPREESLDALSRLGFQYAESGDTLVVTPPAIRTDIGIAEDIVEEVARIVGYDRIPVLIPDGQLPLQERHPLEALREQVRDHLVGFGLQETVSYSLIDPAWLGRLSADGSPIAPAPIRVQNPTSISQSVARPTLRASLLDTAARNLRHRDGVAIFEISPVYLPRAGDLPEERWTIAVLVAGRAKEQTWLTQPRDWDRWDVKGLLAAMARSINAGTFSGPSGPAAGMHPGSSSTRLHDGRPALMIGQLDPRVAARWGVPTETFIGEVDLASLLAVVQPHVAKLPPKYPAALREVAFVVDEAVTYGAVRDDVTGAAKDLLESLTLLDVYRGPQVGVGKKSFALRLVLRSRTGTLTDADVEKVVSRIEGRVLHKLGGTIRG